MKQGNEVVLLEGFDYNASHVTEVIEDALVPPDEIQYEVTYNANRVRPYIWSNGESESVCRQEESLRVGLGMDYFRNDSGISGSTGDPGTAVYAQASGKAGSGTHRV